MTARAGWVRLHKGGLDRLKCVGRTRWVGLKHSGSKSTSLFCMGCAIKRENVSKIPQKVRGWSSVSGSPACRRMAASARICCAAEPSNPVI